MGIQVQELTKGKQPWETEFIDFEFAGKKLSDFGWVAVSSGDRLSFGHSATFEDETSEVNGADGQYFWGTHYKTIKRTFKIATDGVSEQDWNAFKIHFAPGKYGKFIEHHLYHRYSYCRVVDVVVMDVIPFREKKTFLGKDIYINIYKGEASIQMEWDLPYIYSTENLIQDSSEENIMAIYYNGTPMIESSAGSSKRIFIGNNSYLQDGVLYEDQTFTGGTGSASSRYLYYYNPSTAKTALNIKMDFKVTFTPIQGNLSTPIYINTIADEFNQAAAGHDYPYNTISSSESIPIEDTSTPNFTQHFHYSSPNFISSINRTIQIAENFYNINNKLGVVLDLEELIRSEIVNPEVVGWAATVLRILKDPSKPFYDTATGNFTAGEIDGVPNYFSSDENAGTLSVDWFRYFNIFMLMILGERGTNENFHIENEDAWTGNFYPFSMSFNGEESLTKVSYSYNSVVDTVTKNTVQEKQCGDAIYSEYLKPKGGDQLDENGKIVSTHCLQFLCGGNAKTVTVNLQYKYTYT